MNAAPRITAWRRWAVAAGLALVASIAHAGAVAAQRQPALAFERIAQERGLSNGTVTTMVQDRAGFLWLGTEDGLNRYDGSGFTIFRHVPGDSASLGHAWVTRLLMARDGALWVGTLRGGVQRYDQRTERFTHFRHSPDDASTLSSDEVNTLIQGRDGAIWVGTLRGLDRLDPRTGVVTRYSPTTDSTSLSQQVLALAQDASGVLWVGTRYGLFRADPARGRFEWVRAVSPVHPVRALHVDRSGVVWVGTEAELVALEPASGRALARHAADAPGRPSPFSGRVNTLVEGPDGTLWVGSDRGVAALDPRTGAYVRHLPDPGDPRSIGGHIVRSVLVDRGGVLWVGTESYGLSKHAPSTVRFDLLRHEQSVPNTLSNGYVRGILEDSRDDVWIATQFGGLNRLDRATGRITTYRHRAGDANSLPGDNVWAVLEDRAGTMWVGLHRRGLGTLDPATGRFTPFAGVPHDASVNVLYEDRAGTLVVGLESVGMIEISPDRRRVRRYGTVIGGEAVLATDDVQAVLEDREGVLWVGGDGGLTRLDRRTGQATHHRATAGAAGALPAAFVTNVVEDSRGTIWVATKGGGLSRYDRATDGFTSFGVDEGIPHGFVYGILEDARGRLWVSTDDGIAVLDPATGAVASFGLEDGLQAREFNRRAFHRDRSGTMYFGGINGLNVFNPDEAAPAPPPPPVSLLTLRPGGGAPRHLAGLAPDSVVVLRHDENAFTISFAALDFTAPAKARYAYMLEGLDRHWTPAGARREASYASVPPGRYVLRVRAANGAGVWNEAGAAVTLVVAPPWWGTWWARLIGAALAVGLPLVAVRMRLRAVRRRGEWLERRVEEQTRDLVAAQAQLSAALERERETARELLDITAAVPGAVFQLHEGAGGHRDFPFVSDGIARLWEGGGGGRDGADPRGVAGSIVRRVHPDDASAVREAFARSRDTLEPVRSEVRWTGPGGSTRWLAVQAHPSRRPDGGTVWTGVATDVTAARRAAAEHAALEARMRQAQKTESLGVLAGGIAHDFNNLLVGILANAEMLREEVEMDGERAEMLDAVRTSALRASELTKQLLAYAGRGRFVVERVPLAQLVREMMSLLRSAVPRTTAFELHVEDGDPAVEGDATQLRQVVMNLVTNASEAIGDRAGHVSVRVGVEEAAQRDLQLLHASPEMPAAGPYALIEVTDDGCGMDAPLLARIFDPFYTTKFTGRGLGLAALLGIVRAHRGGLQVATAPGEGARFTLYLPLSAAASTRPAEVESPPSSPPGPRARVLVVDDEDAVRTAAGRILHTLGYDVLAAADGAAALETMAAERDVALVLMDVTMPGMDGPATARALRERGLDVAIVLMSGYAEEELVARGVMTHADAFLAKPFQMGELAEVMREVVEGAGCRV